MNTRFETMARRMFVFIAIAATASFAWKSRAHVYLADMALLDAMDGTVTISFGGSKIGDYPVDPKTLAAIKAYSKEFRAGALGPDAYPDILTGQMLIHPASPGTRIWLSTLWNRVGSSSGADRAFMVGFYAHAAGDLFGHDYVNTSVGGPFGYNQYGAKHIVLESYIEKKLPAQVPAVSAIGISNVESFIYKNMTFAEPGSTLDVSLLTGLKSGLSVPRVFSSLRNILAADTADYYGKKRKYLGIMDQYGKASTEGVKAIADLALLMTPQRIAKTAYEERWIADIDNGLKEWIRVSNRVALALYNNKMDSAKTYIESFVTSNLISMAGAPDWFGPMVTAQTVPQFIQDGIKNYSTNAMNFICMQVFGKSFDQLKQMAISPENEMVALGMNKSTIDNELRLPAGAGTIDWTKVPAMVNTVTMIKLAMLTKTDVNNVITALGGGATLADQNILYGTWFNSLDESHQWRPVLTDYSKAMVFARNDALFNKMFVPATYGALVASGQTTPPPAQPAAATPSTPAPTTPAASPSGSGAGGAGPSGGGGGGAARYK